MLLEKSNVNILKGFLKYFLFFYMLHFIFKTEPTFDVTNIYIDIVKGNSYKFILGHEIQA